jgi:glucose-1-phosphate thymidylyltransferase
MKNGIILAGGTGSRLLPLTQVVNKHLLGVGENLVIDYPLYILKQMGCENVTVILGGVHFSQVVGYLKDGSNYGLNINYVYQGEPKGIAHAINLCERFVCNETHFSVILGDNVFENPIQWNGTAGGAQIVLSDHPDMKRFGVASLNEEGEIVRIKEKPLALNKKLINLAITGCYLFTPQYFDYFKEIKPSQRQEYEITDIIRRYHRDNNLSWTQIAGLWSDAGTHESISYLNNYFYKKEHD